MSSGYTSVQWNRHKKVYDLVAALVIVLGLAGFMVVASITHPRITAETLLIRGTAITAFGLLTVILCLGPLARLDRRFLPLVFNRRHLGVAMFVLALAHGVLAVVQFHGFGDTHPLVSVFTAYAEDYDPFLRQPAAISRFPFEPLGFAALVILFLMAATSHDFWLKNLGASWWKRLHLLVLGAYGLVVLHIAYGALQSERHPALVALLMAALVTVYGLHLAAGWHEAAADHRRIEADHDGRVRAVAVADLVEGRARVVWIGSERVAVWRHRGRIYATANVCRHQGGPLGEGRVLDGCITCPWHGWQYRPEDGQSPPPFDERIPTYRCWAVDGEVWLDPEPDPPGTPQPGALIDREAVHD